MNKLTNSWQLIKGSARILIADKELLIFPVLSTIATLIISASFFLPILMANMVDKILTGGSEVLGYILMFLFYVVQYTVVFYFNTALVGAALIRLRGGDPKFIDGLRLASQRILSILGYALIAATVGMALRMVSERSKGLGKFVVSLVGFAWNIATYLVVPVLAVEGIGPIEAVKRSASLLKKTWGEQIVGNFGIGTAFTILWLVIIIPATILVIYLFSAGVAFQWMIVLVLMIIILLIAVGLVQSTLNSIYVAAVYHYAVSGEPGIYYNEELIKNAFRQG